MGRRGKRPDYSLKAMDHMCWNCTAPGTCASATCPRERLKQVRKWEEQAGDLVACVSTVFWAALTGQDAQAVRQRAARGEYGAARRAGEHLCVGWDGALEREVRDG